MNQNKVYISYTQYFILPSLSLWKLKSICPIEKVDTLESDDTLLLVFHNVKDKETNKQILWYDRELFNFFYKDELCPEMITLIKDSKIVDYGLCN